MAFTLADATYRVSRALGMVTEGVATGGSTTTLVDTATLTQSDDYWNGGTVWVLYDAGGAGAAPQGEYAKVTDFTASSDTATITSLTAAIAAGDRYAIGKKRYPNQLLIQQVNRSLTSMGVIPYVDTSITIASNQTEYTLGTTDANIDIRAVYIQGDNTDSDDNDWKPISAWRIQPAAIGTGHTLVIPQYDSGYKVMVEYARVHPELRVYSDKISESIHPDVIVYDAALKCLMWYKDKTRLNDVAFNENINYMSSLALRALEMHPIRIPKRRSKLLVLNEQYGEGYYPGDRTPR